MSHPAIWHLGCGLIVSAGALYVLSWGLITWRPNWLLGNITLLWFKSLVYMGLGGLGLIVLWALDQFAWTVLFWRR